MRPFSEASPAIELITGGRPEEEKVMTRLGMTKIGLTLAVFVLPWLVATPLAADEGDPPARVARISYLKGNVSLQAEGEDQWGQATLNYTVTTGDRLYTDQGSRAELQVGPYAIRMSDTTDLTLANLNDQVMQLGLEQGSVHVTVFELVPGNTVEVDTPNGALNLLEAGDYRVDSDPNGTLVTVNRGRLEVSGGDVSQTLGSGQAAQLSGTNPIQVALVQPPGRDDFDRWSEERDRRMASPRSAQYVSRYTPGCADLDDYGRWQTVSEYGPVWYPSGVPAGWVPYRFGRWVWVDPWGWTWVEDEPWGFAPFHYGRWAFIGASWGWIPGPVAVVPVYAPALVAFVGGPGFSIGVSVGVTAWFPLGPREPFLPWYHHGDNYMRQVNVTNIRNVTNITNITNITNVNNINYANRQVATTAVPVNAFRNAQPVARQVVRVAPEQVARAQVIPHPMVNPTPRATIGGTPAARPPVRAERPAMAPARGQRVPSPAAPASRTLPPPSPANRPSPPPVITRTGPPPLSRQTEAPPSRPTPPPSRQQVEAPPNRPTPPLVTRPTPPERGPASAAPRTPPPASRAPATPRPLITRTPPPPSRLPYEAKQPAMEQHPGRPLEPQQRDNIRAGRPAGPMRDQEVPAHAQPAPRSAPPERPARNQGQGSKQPSRPNRPQ
jgi:uncharacterized protein DUF6600